MKDPFTDVPSMRAIFKQVFKNTPLPICEICGKKDYLLDISEFQHIVTAFTTKTNICKSCCDGLGITIFLDTL